MEAGLARQAFGSALGALRRCGMRSAAGHGRRVGVQRYIPFEHLSGIWYTMLESAFGEAEIDETADRGMMKSAYAS